MISLKCFATTLFLLASAAAMPVISLASQPRACVAGKPTPESYTWNFHREASQLLAGIQVDAMNAKNQADRLQNFAMDRNIGWKIHAGELTSIRAEVDDIGRKLCRLEAIRRAATPWQQKAIDQTASLVRLMAGNADDAVAFLNTNEAHFWMPTYREYVANLYHESGRLSNSVKTFEEYARVHREDVHLEHSLGL